MNTLFIGAWVLGLLCLAACAVFAQTPSPKIAAANELLKTKNWAEAAKAYEEISDFF